MNTVPKYLILGDGGVAQHACHYLTQLQIPWTHWCRRTHSRHQLIQLIKRASHVLILVSDHAIESLASFVLAQNTTTGSSPILIHFSGALQSPYAIGAHPLQTFKPNVTYRLDEYQAIPFIIDTDAPSFSSLLPCLPNPHHRILAQDRAYYHALCSLANNVTALLWQQVHHRLRDRFNIQLTDLKPILARTFQHIADNPDQAITGPWVRGDTDTLKRNQAALNGDALQGIWSAVHQFYQNKDRNEPPL